MQYLPRVREPKSHNLLLHNGTVDLHVLNLVPGTAVPESSTCTKFSTKLFSAVPRYFKIVVELVYSTKFRSSSSTTIVPTIVGSKLPWYKIVASSSSTRDTKFSRLFGGASSTAVDLYLYNTNQCRDILGSIKQCIIHRIHELYIPNYYSS